MIYTCRQAGLRVYADAVPNHMTGKGNDKWPSHRNGNDYYCAYWGPKNSTAGSPHYTNGYMYENCPQTNDRPGLEYPAVPYGPLDFHCERDITNWADPFQLNYGWLVFLTDLNH
eukprot:CAMPEP_0201281140 /NCGR_PEP_ID=MMETSP1317-20130820/1651_1 /ASSEMBLY_ACC=CAM_ASM_000770 /TAXON_ID=187299 /ORGANISM="Undescribed Undescribed, Strain Undescribed" /LENGTH=113 /DNA_ID=CAMNT_0047590247 /DNA_START=751 /DNA_END=1089 /DNA_ORIENTATION=+